MPGSYMEPSRRVNRRGSDFKLNYVIGTADQQAGTAFDDAEADCQFRRLMSVISLYCEV